MTSFTDNGGTTIQIVRLQLIFWGRAWAQAQTSPSSGAVVTAVNQILNSGYMTGLQQYRNIGLGYLAGSVVHSSSDPPTSFSNSDVQGLVSSLISAGTVANLDPTNQTLYMVIMPQGVSFSTAGVIGEHTYYTDGQNRRVHYGWVTNDGTLVDVTPIFSHELVESCTDPEGTAILGTAGTCSGSGWCEIGDVCEGTNGVVNGATVQSYWSQKDGRCVVFDYPAQTFPILGTQFSGTLAANQAQRWFTYNWLAYEQVVWTVIPTSVNPSSPQVTWTVDIQRPSGAYLTYWINIQNLTASPVQFQANYAILGRG